MSNVGKPAPKIPDSAGATFLKGSGAAAAATALANGPGVVEAAEASRVVGPGGSTITLDVNGKSQKVAVEPRTTPFGSAALRFERHGPQADQR